MEKEYLEYKEGDIFEPLGKKIQILIQITKTFIVFIDENLFIQWYMDKDSEMFKEYYSDISALESEIDFLFGDNPKRYRPKRILYEVQLAEILVCLINNDDNVGEKISAITKRINEEGNVIYRKIILKTSFLTLLIVMGIQLLLYVTMNSICFLKNNLVLQITELSLFGGLGAFLSLFYRAKKIPTEVSMDKNLYETEGGLRIFIGIVAALIVILGIKSKLIFGFLSDYSHDEILMIFFATIAGFSETIIPSISEKVEQKIGA